MKLRLRENSIRLRLLQSEIKLLRANKIVSEKIRFNQFQILTYTLKVSDESESISAVFEDSEIVVEIPSDAARKWMETDLIGLENEQSIIADLTLRILIEKDFTCPDRPFDKDNAYTFPNPKTNC